VGAVAPSPLFSGLAAQSGDSAIDKIRAAKQSDKSSVTVELSSGTETVNLDAAGMDIGEGLELTTANSPAAVTIGGGSRTIALTGSGTGSVITVGDGVTLTLKNITFKGKDDNNAALIKVNQGGTLILEDGAVITGNTNTNTSSSGGGVNVSGGAFTMSAGTISGNEALSKVGGGVYTYEGTFKMSGGTIRGNKAGSGGGGVYINNTAFFTKEPANGGDTSGTIYGADGGELANTATNNLGHAVFVAGDGWRRNNTVGEKVSLDIETESDWDPK
jgi:hypothetical protein